MRYFLLIFLCFCGISASAQWWRIGPLKHKRYPAIAQVKSPFAKKKFKMVPAKVTTPQLTAYTLKNYYDFEKAEMAMMKIMKHNMRYRVYGAASYNFSDLAEMYVEQNRLSEAKWFLLQSNMLSRRQNDDKHTFVNLIRLSSIKMDMGEVSLARQDLLEARAIANSQGWFRESKEIDKKLQSIQGITSIAPKPGLRYAEAVEPLDKSK
ncbi:hypothetical protein EOD41_07300 [Mucilaginibacter limnophilus]|uniref:MalT-like TPR region domain-containing protein n=1 Tax=Mucilaginibacter limnophilus TaxID=1932778 RepID=A0A437MVS5_9SPHI|nr:hypothetical protein [Mucilaginibacter limnophilus]RVU01758.1 hypothetical protein EOD41_07300 [Mucilaginibacter limnophilus]